MIQTAKVATNCVTTAMDRSAMRPARSRNSRASAHPSATEPTELRSSSGTAWAAVRAVPTAAATASR